MYKPVFPIASSNPSLNPNILGENATNFLLLKDVTSASVEIGNVSFIDANANGSKSGFTATLTAGSAIFNSSMVYTPGIYKILSESKLAHGDATIKLRLDSGEHIFGFISGFTRPVGSRISL